MFWLAFLAAQPITTHLQESGSIFSVSSNTDNDKVSLSPLLLQTPVFSENSDSWEVCDNIFLGLKVGFLSDAHSLSSISILHCCERT